MANDSDGVGKVVAFQTENLGSRIAELEFQFQGKNSTECAQLSREMNINHELLGEAFEIKSFARQINVIIHSIGMLLALPNILREHETVQNLSLGAGNSGREFDLETNLRIAEFKFIHWRGGAETIRQNQVFKDFYGLAESRTSKAKNLFVLGKEFPMKFLEGGRAISSVFSRNIRLWKDFQARYGKRFITVQDYYEFKKNEITISDLQNVSPIFIDY